jgi:hypothetical protein
LIREYYRDQGYEDALAKNYTLPLDEPLTVSLNLRQILWCEKDKAFLQKKDARGSPLYAMTPPLRSPHDLRGLQQAARMGIVIGVEVFPGDELFLTQILEREILTPFQLSQMIAFRWLRYSFPVVARETKIALS